MTIITKDIILNPVKHIVTSQNAMCHNFFKPKEGKTSFQSNIATC